MRIMLDRGEIEEAVGYYVRESLELHTEDPDVTVYYDNDDDGDDPIKADCKLSRVNKSS